jgi:DNA-directed RNA polymerase specialized sigma subunit, sigma24 homolog
MTICTDQQALDWLSSGSADARAKAVECLYRRLIVMLRPWAVARRVSSETMHDVLTDAIYVFVISFLNGKYREQGKLEALILLIAQRRYFDHVRNNQRERPLDPDDFSTIVPPEAHDPLEEAETAIENLTKHAKLTSCMDNVGERCKERLIRFWYLNQSHEEIAEAMGDKSADVSKVMKNKCQDKLEKCIKGTQTSK